MPSLGESFRCIHVKAKGIKCRAWSLKNSDYCFFHDPFKSQDRNRAQCKGGEASQRKTLPECTEDVSIETATDIVELLATTISQTRKGEIDSKIATTIGYLSSIVLRAREQGILEERMFTLEKQLNDEKGHRQCH